MEDITEWRMKPEHLTEWRHRLFFSQKKAAEVLGISRNSWAAYESGKRPIPKVVELACAWCQHVAIVKRDDATLNDQTSDCSPFETKQPGQTSS